MRLAFDDLSYRVNGHRLVDELSLEIPDGGVVGLVGPNGSGKSTALRCVYRALAPSSGTVYVGGTDISSMHRRDTARVLAALTQESSSEFDFTVEQLVALGRAPHHRGNRPLDAEERALCRSVMDQVGVLELADRGVLSLSGGERQRVLVARALVQQPRVLVLDEPTNHLDIRHQIELLELLRSTALTVLVVLHDLNLAASVCDRLGVLRQGRLVTVGTPREVLTPDVLHRVFGVSATVVDHPLTGVPQLLYSPASAATEGDHR